MDSYTTPGVYINEIDAFPNSVVPVATAVPAFIGYTPNTEYQGASLINKPQKINSFAEFKAFFMLDDPAPPAAPVKQYSPNYYLIPQTATPTTDNNINIASTNYVILPDPNTIYYLYNSVRLFYQNGGGTAYIVSVGGYGPASDAAIANSAEKIVNANVKLIELQNGLAALKNEYEPTLYICPDATLLTLEDNATLMQSMLQQVETMQTALCIFDVIGGDKPDPELYTNDIQIFRNSVGISGLNYGASYYPFVITNIMQSSEIDFTNFFGGDTTRLAPLLSPTSAPNTVAMQILQSISQRTSHLSNSQLQAALLAASPTYCEMVKLALQNANTLPTSGAIAGVYTAIDNLKGVWNSPANVGIFGAVNLPFNLSDSQQENLNIDEVSGKSINAIRIINTHGILIWGARTLDGNSENWRFVSVRRTMTYIEQSVKVAAQSYVFQPNNANTWAAVKAMISNFLTNLWKEGGLQGATAADAFQVNIGLGTTMTEDDILNGYMRVVVQVAVVRPAEFMVITFEQQQAKSG